MAKPKRNFKKEQAPVAPPADQNITGGITLVMAHHSPDHRSGKRTKFVEYKEVKFKDGADVAAYFESHCHQKHIKDVN